MRLEWLSSLVQKRETLDKMIAIINYEMGNLGSIKNMLSYIGIDSIITNDRTELMKADKLILPGIGSFDKGMEQLEKLGLIPIIKEAVLKFKKPILGICLGMQLLGVSSMEGKSPGLGLIDFETVKFVFESNDIKIPHMGWNYTVPAKKNPLTDELPENSRFYFVHTYYAKCKNQIDELLATEYHFKFTSAVHKDNVYGVQFHPEKSHKFGMKLLENFAKKV